MEPIKKIIGWKLASDYLIEYKAEELLHNYQITFKDWLIRKYGRKAAKLILKNQK